MSRAKQAGTVLMLCLTLMVLLGLLGLSAMQAATQQQRMASNLLGSIQAFEAAEQLLRVGEAHLSVGVPEACGFCLPPPEAQWVASAGSYRGERGSSGLPWQRGPAGFYLIQNLGLSTLALGMPEDVRVTLVRITAIGLERELRVVLESTFAWPDPASRIAARRVAWRQVF